MGIRKNLTDAQWEKISPHLPVKVSKGRPWCDNRKVFEGILWVLRSGARWQDLPRENSSPSTCWRRLKLWEEEGIWLKVWRIFLGELDAKGTLDWSETFMDGSFAPAKKGVRASEKPNVERVRSGWWWSTARVFLWEANLPRQRPRK